MEAASGVSAPGLGREDRDRRPVLLATLGVPIEHAAAIFAVDAAVESGEPLVVANVVELPPLPMSVHMGYDQLEDRPDVVSSLHEPAQLARSLGVAVERLRVKSPRPVEALVQLASELHAGLLVFGPDRSRLGKRRYRKAAEALEKRAACLVWLP